MTLDLDAGTLLVFKDGQRVGVMKAGLSGEYCWFIKGEARSSQGRAMVSIEWGNESQAFDVGSIIQLIRKRIPGKSKRTQSNYIH